jgi:hypothetical protein
MYGSDLRSICYINELRKKSGRVLGQGCYFQTRVIAKADLAIWLSWHVVFGLIRLIRLAAMHDDVR